MVQIFIWLLFKPYSFTEGCGTVPKVWAEVFHIRGQTFRVDLIYLSLSAVLSLTSKRTHARTHTQMHTHVYRHTTISLKELVVFLSLSREQAISSLHIIVISPTRLTQFTNKWSLIVHWPETLTMLKGPWTTIMVLAEKECSHCRKKPLWKMSREQRNELWSES